MPVPLERQPAEDIEVISFSDILSPGSITEDVSRSHVRDGIRNRACEGQGVRGFVCTELSSV